MVERLVNPMPQAERDARLAKEGWRPIGELVQDGRKIEVMNDCFAIDPEIVTAHDPRPNYVYRNGRVHPPIRSDQWDWYTHYREVTS